MKFASIKPETIVAFVLVLAVFLWAANEALKILSNRSDLHSGLTHLLVLVAALIVAAIVVLFSKLPRK